MVVLRDSPLSASGRRLLHDPAVDEPVTHLAVSAVQPVVERMHQAVVGVLGVPWLPVAADLPLLIADQIAVRIAAVPEPRWFRHEHPSLHERERPRHHEPIQKHGRLVHGPIVVGVFEHDDATDRISLAGALDVAHVAAVFDGPDPPVGIEFEEHGIDHQRLGRHALDAESRRDLKRLERLRRREGGSGWHLDVLEKLLCRERVIRLERLLAVRDHPSLGHGLRPGRHGCRWRQHEPRQDKDRRAIEAMAMQ